MELITNNYDYVKVFLNERCRISETVIETFITHLGEYIRRYSPNDKIDHQVMGFTILAFTYFLIFDKNQGRLSINHEEALERFIDHSVMILEA